MTDCDFVQLSCRFHVYGLFILPEWWDLPRTLPYASCYSSFFPPYTLLCPVIQSCLTLCDPMDYSLPGSSVHEIILARILEWVAISSSRHLPGPGIKYESLYLQHWQVDSLPPCQLGSPYALLKWSEVAQLCPTLCDPMDYSLPCSSIHGIFQARVLEWIAISFSRGPSLPRDQTRVSHIAGRHLTTWATKEAL